MGERLPYFFLWAVAPPVQRLFCLFKQGFITFPNKRSPEQGRWAVFAALIAKGMVFLLIPVMSGLKRFAKF